MVELLTGYETFDTERCLGMSAARVVAARGQALRDRKILGDRKSWGIADTGSSQVMRHHRYWIIVTTA